MTPDLLRTLLLMYSALAFALTLAYLRRRRLTLAEWAYWGMIALLFPIFGPFFVIAARPGPGPHSRRRASTPRRF